MENERAEGNGRSRGYGGGPKRRTRVLSDSLGSVGEPAVAISGSQANRSRRSDYVLTMIVHVASARSDILGEGRDLSVSPRCP